MKSATMNGKDLRGYLLELIFSDDKVTMDNVTDEIFSEIKKLDKDNLYELSIALTNCYFETFWLAAMMKIAHEKTKRAQEILIWACENAWKQDHAKNYNFHKGTPYFFLGRCYLMNGNLDLGFQMVHSGHIENLATYRQLRQDYKIAPSYLFMVLNKNVPDNALYDYVLRMTSKVDQFIDYHNKYAATPISYEIFDKKFLQRPKEEFDEIKFVLVYLLMNLINLDKYDRKPLNENSFSNLKKN